MNNKQILIIPDVHGRTFWKEAINKFPKNEFPNMEIIFLGDYLDPYTGYEDINKEQAYDNFKEIIEVIPFDKIFDMYHPYHEMDIMQFCDTLFEILKSKRKDTALKSWRVKREFSQKDLSDESGVSLRSIQQYEQRQKNINNAKLTTVLSLAKTLGCTPEDLYEKLEP